MRVRVSPRFLLSLFLILAAVPLAAQTTTGSLQGKVVDESGAVLPGATVELSGQAQIGIRMALGAPRGAVVRLLASRGARVVVTGFIIGALAGAAAGRLLDSMLYGVSTFDAVAFAIATAVLLAITGAANLIPTLAAMRVDPVTALRSE